MIEVGRMIRFVPHFFESARFSPQERKAAMISAEIVYVNDAHRMFLVEWESYGVPIREAFLFADIGERVRLYGRS